MTNVIIMRENFKIDPEKEKTLNIVYYVAAIFAVGSLIVDMKARGEDFGLDTMVQIVFYLAILVVIKFIILRLGKIKNKDVQKEAMQVSENFESMAESSLFHIFSMIISMVLTFLVFSLSFIAFLLNEYFVIISLGLSIVSFPVFYFLAYNCISFRRIYIRNKNSRPVVYPLFASAIAMFGLIPMVVDVSGMIFIGRIPNEFLGGVLIMDLVLIVYIDYKYFKLIQKIEITQQDVRKKAGNVPLLKD